MYLAILGRQPKIGFAELESVLGSENVSIVSENVAFLDVENINYRRFGSVIKFAKVNFESNQNDIGALQKPILNILENKYPAGYDGKINFAISYFGQNISVSKINALALSVKKSMRQKNYSIRVIPNKTLALSSAQVIHNKLTKTGTEVLILRANNKYIVASTVQEQDIEAYTARDQARPQRDARVGMLPPKLAQTIINLAVGQNGDWGPGNGKWDKTKPPVPISQPPAPILLDCFCGTGVILQEALLMGFGVYGTDLEPRMIEYTKKNLEWLSEKYDLNAHILLNSGDATSYSWQPMPGYIAAETYLGRPLNHLPKPEVLNQIVQDVNTLHKKALENIYRQLPRGGKMCLAVPAWQLSPGRFKSLPILDQLGKIGYNQLEFKNVKNSDLIYARPDQIVGRQLVVVTK